MVIYFVLALTLLSGASLPAARVILILYALELGAQPYIIGVLAATFSVFALVLSVPAGRLVDRFGARWLLLFAAVTGGLATLVPYFVPNLAAIFFAAAMIGLADGIFSVSLQNLVGLLSDPQNRARNFSNYSLMGSTASLVGPLVAGFSIDFSGYAMACVYLAALTLMPVPILAIRKGALRGRARRAVQPGGSVRDMLSEPGVRRLLATSSLLNAGNQLYQIYVPVYGHAIGLSASGIGIMLSTQAAAVFVARLALPYLLAKYKEEKLLTYTFYVGAASLTLIPLFENAAVLALVSCMFGLGMGVGQPIITMLMFSRSLEGRSGEALGLRMTVNHLTKMIGPVVFGYIASALGLLPMFWINALMIGAGSVVTRTKTPG